MRTRGKFAILATVAAALLLARAPASADIPLNGDEVKCVNALNKRGAGVAKAQNKENRGCVKDKGKGNLVGTVDTCLTADPKQKVAKKKQKTTDDFIKKCGDVPDVGPTSVSTVNTASQDESIGVAEDLFDTPLDPAILLCSSDKPNCKCQDAVIKDAGKLFNTKVKEYLKCKKEKGKAGITSAADLEDCIDGAGTPKAGSIVVDGKGKIAKKVTKLGDDIGKKCGGVPATNAFPGECTGLGGNALRDCVDAIVECHVCLMLNAMDDLNVNCDLFDDGLLNSSCGAPTVCPLVEGIYTNTQTAGGLLTVDGITPFPFPTGGVIVQHVSAASLPNCVHSTVVPDPGGFSAPLFCIPSLNFSVQVAQDGCGVGRIDSNGGSDFTIEEIGDTSSPVICGLPASNCNTPPGDSNVQVNVDVGNSVADVCGSGTANAAVSVPVHTITWAHVPTINCVMSGPDTTGPGGMGDTTVVEFDQTLDFTTDATSADWSDLDADGCCLAGNGPASVQLCAFGGGGPGGLSGSGTCIDLTGVNIAGPDTTTVAAGAIGSNGSPLYDLTFLTNLPNEVTGPSGLPTAACGSPPLINFTGSVTRCVP